MSKVTLKIGDKFSSAILFENLVITEFVDSKIYMSHGKYWNVPLRWDYYYVNDVKYAKEDIIVPTVEEFEPITKDNIAEVLEYNGLKDTFSGGTNARSIIMGSGTPEWCSVNFKNPNWLQIIEAHLGKKLTPLPKKANPFDVVKVGQWVRCASENIRTTKNKWYQRVLSTSRHDAFWYLDDTDVGAYSITTTHWDLTDIRDYNPDEKIVLKVGGVYINSHGDKYTIEAFDYVNNAVIVGSGCWRYFNEFTLEAGIISVNGRQGKYVIPPFDFVQTLLDNGFKHLANTDVYVAGKHTIVLRDKDTVYVLGHKINPTPENAKRLVDIAKILKELEV